MRRYREFVPRVTAARLLLLMLLFPLPAKGAEQADMREERIAAETIREDEDQLESAEDDGEGDEDDSRLIHHDGFAGYRFLDIHSYGGRAATYDYLHSSGTGGLAYTNLGDEQKFVLEGAYNNRKDYTGDLLFDYAGDYRFHLRTESFYHNLDHLLFPWSTFSNYSAQDLNPGAAYGITTSMDTAVTRLKLHDFPFHLNLGYQRLVKDGTRQLIFADQAFEGGPNTVYSMSRSVTWETHHGKAGFDVHLGPVDLIYSFNIRQFENNSPSLRTSYVGRPDRLTGDLLHNSDPDSRLLSHTVKLHTSLSGGLTGAASYTYSVRENRSTPVDVAWSKNPRTTLYNLAGDVTYMPCSFMTLALKYRRQQVEETNPTQIASLYAIPETLSVKPAPDTSRDVISMILSWHPDRLLSVKGEYRGDFVRRSPTTDLPSLNGWVLPEKSDTHTGTLMVLSRPVKGLRVKALYSYSTTDHPAYGTSYSDRNEGQFLATYSRSGVWGGSLSYRARRDSNDKIQATVISGFPDPLEYSLFNSSIARHRDTDNATASFWVSPINRLTISGSYGFLRSAVRQTVLFAVLPPYDADGASYTSQGQVYSLSATYNVNDRFDLSGSAQQVRSISEFSPDELVTASSDTSGIESLTRVRTVENSLSLRGDYRIAKHVSCSLVYTYRKYDDKESSQFDGTVNSILAMLSASW